MATLAIDLDELYANIGTILGVARTRASWDTTTQDDVDRIIRMGSRRYYNAYDWKYLVKHISMTTAAPYDTGTVTIASGVVTLVGGVFPAAAEQSILSLVTSATSTTSGLFHIASRDGDTQITLEDTSVTVASAQSFNLYQHQYALPSSFGGFLDPVTIENQDRTHLREAAVLPDYYIKAINNRKTLRTDEPELFAITQLHASDETGVPTHYMEVWPLPDKVYVMKSRMRLTPGDSLAEVGDIAHPVFSESLNASILGTAEIMFTGQAGVHEERFNALLPSAIRQDKRMHGTRSVRPRDPRNPLPRNYELIVGDVSFDSDATLP